MIFNNVNAIQCLDYDFHDAEIVHFNWDINAYQLHVTLLNRYRKKHISMRFFNVMFIEGATVGYSHGRCYVNSFDIVVEYDFSDVVKNKIYALQNCPPEDWMFLNEDDLSSMMVGRFLLASMEFLFIACKGVEIDQNTSES